MLCTLVQKYVFCQGLILDLLGLARGHKHAWMTLFLFADVRCEVLNVVGFAVKIAVNLASE